MSEQQNRRRIVIAITEATPVRELWHAAIEASEGAIVEVMVVYIDDERWQRAASLPFTCEISRLGGKPADFTARRARRLLLDSITSIKAELDALATQSGRAIRFEMLPGSDQERTRQLIGDDREHLLILPEALTRLPLFTELTRLKVDIRIVETPRDS